jgi:hypothetical protein
MNGGARSGGHYDLKTVGLIGLFFIGTGTILLYLIPLWGFIQENPSYSFNEEHAKEIFYKYDLKNNSNPLCNDHGCGSINPIMADAWKDLCSKDGNCDGHVAFHFWYSKNPEVEKVKALWMKLNMT